MQHLCLRIRSRTSSSLEEQLQPSSLGMALGKLTSRGMDTGYVQMLAMREYRIYVGCSAVIDVTSWVLRCEIPQPTCDAEPSTRRPATDWDRPLGCLYYYSVRTHYYERILPRVCRSKHRA
jgi:hypothetical protein